MSQRIRYIKDGGSKLVSLRVFQTPAGQTVRVALDVVGKKYSILDATTGAEVATGGNTRNLAVLKIQAKKGLTGLGVSFNEEKRNRGDAEAVG